jgi:cell shape-determining protein MreD
MKAQLRLFSRYGALLLLLCLAQIIGMPLIAVAGVSPDIVLLGVVVIALRSGQLHATVAGFLAGLFIDCSIGEVMGLSALAMTIAGFAAGTIFQPDNTERAYRSPRFIGATALAALVHQAVFVFGYVRSVDSDLPLLLLRHGAGMAAYTTICAVVFVLIASRLTRRISFSG